MKCFWIARSSSMGLRDTYSDHRRHLVAYLSREESAPIAQVTQLVFDVTRAPQPSPEISDFGFFLGLTL